MLKKIIIFLVLLILLVSIAFSYLWFHGVAKKIFIAPISINSGNSIQDMLNNKKDINIVLLGYGGGTHDGAYLTDSIMAVNINNKLQKISLISIPRDIWIKIPTSGEGGNYSKINAAYEIGLDDLNYPNKQPQFKGPDGGGRLAEYMVSQVTGLPIKYFVGMDFVGFKHTIDTLGGVDIDVEPAFTDPSYPIDGKEDDPCGFTDQQIASLSAAIASNSASESDAFPCRFETLHFDAGQQHMDGERALSYVRSRHSATDGTDFGRAKRQRNLLVAVKAKIFSAGFIPQIIPFISSLGDDFRTDLSPDDIKTFLQNINTLNKYQISTFALTDQNYLIDTVSDDGQDILEPKDGLDNWVNIHNFISDTISGKQQPVSAVVKVENGTNIPSLAEFAVNNLNNHKIETLPPSNSNSQTLQNTSITVYSQNIDPNELSIIKQEFGVQTISISKENSQGYNILVVIGSDYNKKQNK